MSGAPPAGLAAVVRHEGFVVDQRVPVDAALGSIIVSGSVAVAIAGGLMVGPVGILAGVPVLGGLVTLWPVRWRLEVTDRWVQVDRRGALGSRRHRVPLEALERWYVAEPREDYSGYALILRHGEETVRALDGMPEEHLRWVAAGIGIAVETHRRREAVEGREWGFQKKAPQEIRALVERE